MVEDKTSIFCLVDRGQRQPADHLAGVARDQSATQNSPAFLFVMNSRKAFLLAVEDRSIDMAQDSVIVATSNPAARASFS